MNSFCHGVDPQTGEKRGTHKPVPGTYDGQPIVTCAWCGKRLETEGVTTKLGYNFYDQR